MNQNEETKPINVKNEANGGQTKNVSLDYSLEKDNNVMVFIGTINDKESAALKASISASIPEDMKVEIVHLETQEIENIMKTRRALKTT